jgi:HD-GYP domain-containing protein (c-di-GMP phosphodiesterase class II)
LKKPGALTADERREIEQHASIGAEIIGRLEVYAAGVDSVRHHHERWDGTGYPDRLRGEEIPLGARIIAVADAFDAMTSDRVYRRALPVDVALTELRKGSGSQFDPQIVELFERAIGRRTADPSAQPEIAPAVPERAPNPVARVDAGQAPA